MAATRPAPRFGSDSPEPNDNPSSETVHTNGAAVRTGALIGLVVLASFFTLYAFRVFFLPLFLAILLDLLLSPVVRMFQRWGVPTPIAATIILAGFLGGVGFGAYKLAGPAREWASELPQKINGARDRLRNVIKPVQAVKKTAEEVQKAAAGAAAPSGKDGEGRAQPRPPQVVTVQEPSSMSGIFGTTQAFVTMVFETLVLLFFLLASGSLFTQKIVKVLPRLRDKKKALSIAHAVEGSVSKYLLTQATINAGEGVIVALAMWALGMPNPPLWGVLAALLIFIPYVGALTMGALLFIVGITTFDGVGHALAVPGVFYAIDIIQANFVSPFVMGDRMTLNPVAIFVSILLWGHLWGVPGVLMAVPLAVAVKIFCDHVDALAPVGEFLGK